MTVAKRCFCDDLAIKTNIKHQRCDPTPYVGARLHVPCPYTQQCLEFLCVYVLRKGTHQHAPTCIDYLFRVREKITLQSIALGFRSDLVDLIELTR